METVSILFLLALYLVCGFLALKFVIVILDYLFEGAAPTMETSEEARKAINNDKFWFCKEEKPNA